MRAWEFPDCTEEEAAVTARLEKLSMKVLQDDLASETDFRQAPEMMEPSTHVSHYRDFSDVYEAVPISYLTGISESRRNTPQGKEFHRLFEVDEIFTNTSNPPPPNVISWALFIPRPAPAGKEHIYGPTSREENSYIRKEKAAPTSLKEAKTGTNYHKDSFFGKYVRRMIESHAKVSKRLLSWRVRIHLAPGLHFFVPIFLELGNIEVYLMKGPSIRTSGALWRWLPFADRTIPGAVVALDSDDTNTAFHNWPAVQSWERTSLSHLRWVHGWDTAYYKNWVPYDDWEKQHEKPGCSANKGQKWHGGEVRKWIATDKTYVPTYGVDVPVESRASRDADHPKFCGCHNYAPAQANLYVKAIFASIAVALLLTPLPPPHTRTILSFFCVCFFFLSLSRVPILTAVTQCRSEAAAPDVFVQGRHHWLVSPPCDKRVVGSALVPARVEAHSRLQPWLRRARDWMGKSAF